MAHVATLAAAVRRDSWLDYSGLVRFVLGVNLSQSSRLREWFERCVSGLKLSPRGWCHTCSTGFNLIPDFPLLVSNRIAIHNSMQNVKKSIKRQDFVIKLSIQFMTFAQVCFNSLGREILAVDMASHWHNRSHCSFSSSGSETWKERYQSTVSAFPTLKKNFEIILSPLAFPFVHCLSCWSWKCS